jgi:hypothetical protein
VKTRNAWLATAAVVGFMLASVLQTRPQAAGQDPKPPVAAGNFEYFPRGSGGWQELCDTRTGTVYRRTADGGWEVYCKPPQ